MSVLSKFFISVQLQRLKLEAMWTRILIQVYYLRVLALSYNSVYAVCTVFYVSRTDSVHKCSFERRLRRIVMKWFQFTRRHVARDLYSLSSYRRFIINFRIARIVHAWHALQQITHRECIPREYCIPVFFRMSDGDHERLYCIDRTRIRSMWTQIFRFLCSEMQNTKQVSSAGAITIKLPYT